MLRHYEVNLPGPSHVKLGTPCQDSCAVAECDGVVIAAVADGLGSESHSDVGSKVAANAAVAYCEQNLASCARLDDAASLLRAAYHAAYEAVLDEAARAGLAVGQMDCTLCLALFDGRAVAYGQSGDSGLVVARDDGSYEVVTRMQRDQEGRVFPLCFDDRWEFGCREGVATVMLCTDGVLEDLIAPPILARHAGDPIDARLARGFLHPDLQTSGSLEKLRTDAERYLDEYPAELLDDDKTAVVIFDDERPPGEMPAPYYEGPDWDAVCAKAHALVRKVAASPPPTDGAPQKDRKTGPAPCDSTPARVADDTGAAVPRKPATPPHPQAPPETDADALMTAAEDALCQLGKGAIAVAAVVAEGTAVAAEKINERRRETTRGRGAKPKRRKKA